MTRVKVGWLADGAFTLGGASLSSKILLRDAPDWAEIVLCPASRRPTQRIDLFVVQNCYSYDHRWIDELEVTPVVKVIRDWWMAGDARLRRWLLDNAKVLVFGSEMHVEFFQYDWNVPVMMLPPPVDLELFRQAAKQISRKSGNVWIAANTSGAKGLGRALDWALIDNHRLDVYCPRLPKHQYTDRILFKGGLEYQLVPETLAQYEQFVFLPGLGYREPFGRTVVEAWAAGCRLIVENAGAMEWIDRKPDELETASFDFWKMIKDMLS